MPLRPGLVLMLLTAASAQAEDRFALVIGANAGWSNDRPLRHAEADAERVRATLVELGGFAPDRVELLRDPDTAEVRSRLRRLAETLRALPGDSLVLFFYSGHADERHLHLRGAPLAHQELYAQLRDLPARVRVGILDACRSGSILGAKGGAPTATFAVDVQEPIEGVALITSSGADELSQESRALAGSVFTHHLVSGLRGAADADEDGAVTLGEAYRYAHARTEADTAATAVPQRPAFRYELKGQGEVALTRLARGAASLVLPPGEELRYVVVDRNEWQLVAEGRAHPAREVRLSLSPGDYQVKRVLPDHLQVAAVSLAPGAQVEAGALSYSQRPLSAGVVKGRPEETSPASFREFRRGEALSLLAVGEAGAALAIFEEILRQKPDDLPSLRGKGRALVRLAEAYDRVGDHERERQSLRRALAADPSLAGDPDFERWYRRLNELEAQERRDAEIRNRVEQELRDNPRLAKRWGIGFDLVSTRGILVVVGSVIATPKLFVDLGVDLAGPGLDLDARFVPFAWRISPYVGAGGHVAGWTLGLGRAGSGTVGNNDRSFAYHEIWGKALHLDAGVQYFGDLGFSAELGAGLLAFPHPVTGALETLILPNLHAGWYF